MIFSSCVAHILIFINPRRDIQDLITSLQLILTINSLSFIYNNQNMLMSSHRNKFPYIIHHIQTFPSKISQYRRKRRNKHYYLWKRNINTNIPNVLPHSSFAIMTKEEKEESAKSDFEINKNKFLHSTFMMFELPFEISLDNFVKTINPLETFQKVKTISDEFFLNTIKTKLSSPLSAIGTCGYNIAMCSSPKFNKSNEEEEDQKKLEALSITTVRGFKENNNAFTKNYQKSFCTVRNNNPPIVIDTGASTGITPILSDFISELTPSPNKEVNQLSGKTHVVGKGTVKWEVQDMWNNVFTLITEAYYIPNAAVRLFSPQKYFQEQNEGKCIVEKHKISIHIRNKVLEFPYNLGGNLPLVLPDQKQASSLIAGLTKEEVSFLAKPPILNAFLSVVDQTNQNITPSQKELLLWHQRLGHINMHWVKYLCAKPRKTNKGPKIATKCKHVSTCENPICTACHFAKQTRRNPSTKSISRPPAMILRRDDLQPGRTVSMDQYISKTPGRLPHTFGKERVENKYVGGTIFVDHASGYVFVRHQNTLNALETIKSKIALEQLSKSFGVKIESYLTDHIPFNSEEFVENIELNRQQLRFSGVGAHHQNGVAERSIRTIVQLARSMLLHSISMWPNQANLELWPYAMNQAVYIYNNTPKPDCGLAPIELFSKTKFVSYEHLRRLHVFGCRVFVLDPKLQDGNRIPKWKARSRRGQYVGIATDHSTTVGCILNINSGKMSPQYHVVYDDTFSSVPNAESGGINKEAEITAEHWKEMTIKGLERSLPDPDPELNEMVPPLADEWLEPKEILNRNIRRERRKDAQRTRLKRLLDNVETRLPPRQVPEGGGVATDASSRGR